MVLPGHIAGGYLVAEALIALTNPGIVLTGNEVLALTLIGTIAGEFPDIDLFRFTAEEKSGKRKVENHREYVTHAPIFWLLFSTLICGIGLLTDSLFMTYLGIFVLGGAWSHLFLDSIEYGVRWFWPYSNKRFAMMKDGPAHKVTKKPGTLKAHWEYISTTYLKTWTIWAELALTLIAIVIALQKYWL